MRDSLKAATAATAIAAAVSAPYWFWQGGVLELEVLQFIQQYLDGRPVLAKIFDPYRNDFGTYQGRELSYFVDYLDAHVFAFLMRQGWIVFLPISAIVSSIASAVIIVRGLRRYALGAGLSTLLALLYLTNYVHVVTMGMFYRATKPLVAPLLLAVVFYLTARLSELAAAAPEMTTSRRVRSSVAVFVLLLLMGLLDRQGHFYALTGAAVLAAWTIFDRRAWHLAAGAIAAAGLVTAYNWWIGPAIIYSVNGYTPGFDYQQIPSERLQDLTPFRKALAMLAENSTLLLGSTSIALTAAVMAGAGWAGIRSAPARRWRLTLLVLIGAVAASQVVMFGLMIARHAMVYDWIDHRYWYYPLPFQALLFAGLAVLLGSALHKASVVRRTIVAALIMLLIAGNLWHWTAYRNVMMNSRWFNRVYPQTMILKQSLETNDADPRLIIQYYKFYEFCQKLRGGS